MIDCMLIAISFCAAHHCAICIVRRAGLLLVSVKGRTGTGTPARSIMLTLAAAFHEVSDTPTRKRLLIATQGGPGSSHWLPAHIDRDGAICCDQQADVCIELEEEAMDAIRLFVAGSLSSCALVARLGDTLGVGALVMGAESPSDAMRMLDQLKSNALGRFVENYLAELQQRRPAKVYPFRPR
jgi:hypothetical protein